MEILRIEHVGYTYKSCGTPALCDISLAVDAGDMVLVCGKSGCGKSTLLKSIKPVLLQGGKTTGQIYYTGRKIETLSQLESACDIGFVEQDTESQLVTDTVLAELCFGLESLGYPSSVIRRRIAEMTSFFGLSGMLGKKVSELSGGQQQMINLASVLSLSPRLLLLDEPTSQLDPVAAKEFIEMLGRLNRELGITVIVAEQRTEELFSLCDKVLLMSKGRVEIFADTDQAAKHMASGSRRVNNMLLPTAAQIFAGEETIPLTVRDGRELFAGYVKGKEPPPITAQPKEKQELAVEIKGVSYSYTTADELVLKELTLNVQQGGITAVMGDNGAGKSTLIKAIAGLLLPQRGSISVFGKPLKKYKSGLRGIAAYLPQDPKLMFIEDSLQEEFKACAEAFGISDGDKKTAELTEKLGIAELLEKHPYDISAGELQRAALCKVLLAGPRLLLLDEPTKALDPESRAILGGLLKDLRGQGITIIMASHDVEFCAEYCDECVLLFDGAVASKNKPRFFFGANIFYTTAANRIARGYSAEAITAADVRKLCGL